MEPTHQSASQIHEGDASNSGAPAVPAPDSTAEVDVDDLLQSVPPQHRREAFPDYTDNDDTVTNNPLNVSSAPASDPLAETPVAVPVPQDDEVQQVEAIALSNRQLETGGEEEEEELPKVVAQPAHLLDFLENRNLQVYLGCTFCLAVIVTAVVSVVVYFLTRKGSSTVLVSVPPTLAPTTLSPTMAPSNIPSNPPPTSPPTLPNVTPEPTPIPLVLDLPSYTRQALQNPQSPQAMAYSWLEAHPLIDSMQPFEKEQAMAFLSIYYSLNGDESFWGREYSATKGNFGSYDVPFCQWTPFQVQRGYLARCNNLGQLTSIDLHDVDGDSITSRRRGTLPNEVSLLSNLKALQINNCIMDQFQVQNFFPTTLPELTNLEKIQYDYNNFRGTIPATIVASLTQLTSLSLDINALSGTIPTDIFLLTNLRFLSLAWNSFRGTIPTEIGLLTELRTLRLYKNSLVAPFPSNEIQQLTNLRTLELQNTDISGALPNGFCTSLSLLQELRLDCHQLACAPDCGCSCGAI